MYRLGCDIGSTTVKTVLLSDADAVLAGFYERHFSDIPQTLVKMLASASEITKNAPVRCVFTGSGGFNFAERLGVSFLQEVIAVSRACLKKTPDADVCVEIGGEDAKIIYFADTLELRMNGICAGGTGSFIDQMAYLMQTDALGLNDLAAKADIVYPIAARCGVFAKSDVQPLMNDGAAKTDIAASVFQAVVSQTISGLACGKPIRGKVIFLGGSMFFLPEPKKRFAKTLNLTDGDAISPENAHLFAALSSYRRSKR